VIRDVDKRLVSPDLYPARTLDKRMIAIQKQDGKYRPIIACDHCGKVIDDAMNALELSSSAREGAMAEVFYVHKGECEKAVSEKLGGMHGSEELTVHLFQLLRNTLAKSDPHLVQNLTKWLEQD
jgi:hypothetical protein